MQVVEQNEEDSLFGYPTDQFIMNQGKNCNKKSHEINLSSPLDKHTESGMWYFYCDYCSYKSIRKSDLKKHLLLHTREKKFQCPHCVYRSHHRQQLNIHIKTKHISLDNLLCFYCQYRATDLHNLNNHTVQAHVNENTHTCSFCPYITSTRSSLSRHQVTHFKKWK